MKHRFEIEEEIERVYPHTYISNGDSWDAHASDYANARKWSMYHRTLKAFLVQEDGEKWIKKINKIIKNLENEIKKYKNNKDRSYFKNEYEVESTEDDIYGTKSALNFINSDSEILQKLYQKNEKLEQKIKEIQEKITKNEEKIKIIKKDFEKNEIKR